MSLSIPLNLFLFQLLPCPDKLDQILRHLRYWIQDFPYAFFVFLKQKYHPLDSYLLFLGDFSGFFGILTFVLFLFCVISFYWEFAVGEKILSKSYIGVGNWPAYFPLPEMQKDNFFTRAGFEPK